MTVDSTLSLLLRGYTWAPRLRSGLDGGPPPARLLGRPVRVLRGPEDVRFFYDERHAHRSGALPGPVLDTLFGRGAVHTLDAAVHRRRKELFLTELTAPDAVRDLAGRVREEFRDRLDGLRGREAVLFDEGAAVLARAVGAWAGLPPDAGGGRSAERLARDCVAMVDGFATPGPRHLRARRARSRQEALLGRAVEEVRRRSPEGPPRTPFEAVVAHRDAGGNLLDPATAAVELLNIVRPTVAVTWFVTFAAHAMHRSPRTRERLAEEGPAGYAVAFAHEVRRFYPFVPFVGALGQDGTLLLLDVFGQNHDPALWDEPYRFAPGRFLHASPGRDTLVPQGGGPREGHRCPGEDITVAVLAGLAVELARCRFTVPEQDLRIPLHRVPTRPRSGFRIAVGP